MKCSRACLAICLGIAATLSGCDLGDPSTNADPQRVKVFFKFDYRDQVDTFNGMLTKDLVINGTITVPFGFKQSEQDILLSELARAGFFGLPDTLYPVQNVTLSPNPGIQVLRVQFEGATKSLVWTEVLNESDPRTGRVRELWTRLQNLVRSTETYRQLPPPLGGYL